MAKHRSLIDSIGKTLNRLYIKWVDWDEFKEKRRRFEWTTDKKTGKRHFRFEDLITCVNYDSNVKNTHRSLVNHARISYDFDNYSKYNTRGLLNCMETGVSNFFFKKGRAPIADGVTRFLIKSRADIQFTPKKDPIFFILVVDFAVVER
jgi:hypothetical protein